MRIVRRPCWLLLGGVTLIEEQWETGRFDQRVSRLVDINREWDERQGNCGWSSPPECLLPLREVDAYEHGLHSPPQQENHNCWSSRVHWVSQAQPTSINTANCWSRRFPSRFISRPPLRFRPPRRREPKVGSTDQPQNRRSTQTSTHLWEDRDRGRSTETMGMRDGRPLRNPGATQPSEPAGSAS